VVSSERFEDDRFRLRFTRLVTHYFGNAGFLPDDGIVGRLDRIAHVPAVFVRGRLDIASPLSAAWEVSRRLPRAELHVIEDAGHGCGDEGDEVVVRATDRFAG
jgi:proline iminopeptidase